jgi:hypothetical protein
MSVMGSGKSSIFGRRFDHMIEASTMYTMLSKMDRNRESEVQTEYTMQHVELEIIELCLKQFTGTSQNDSNYCAKNIAE